MVDIIKERLQHENSPEGRLAAVARALVLEMWDTHIHRQFGPEKPDTHDFREALRPFVKIELLLARIEEARKLSGRVLTERVKELSQELVEARRGLPPGLQS